MRNRGISNIIFIVLVILLVFVLVLILYNILKKRVAADTEIAEVRIELLAEDMSIDGVSGDLTYPSQINLTISKGPSKMILQNVTIVRPKIDIVFLIDSTGSMTDEIKSVTDTINNFTLILENKSIDYRLALIEFKDYPISPCGIPGDFPSKVHSFFSKGMLTNNTTEFRARTASITVGGGDDWPESHLSALNDSINLIPYRDGAQRVNIMLTDEKPHAKDCSCGLGYSGYSGCYKNLTGFNWTYPPSCYSGPETVQEVTNSLVVNKIAFYYINKNYGLCYNSIMANGMTSATGGRFYSYTEALGVSDIIKDLAEQIIENYVAEKEWNHLKVMFYNDTDSYEYKIYNPPKPLETRTYEIPIGEVLKDYITNIKKIKIYPVIVTDSGTIVIGQPLDTWNAYYVT